MLVLSGEDVPGPCVLGSTLIREAGDEEAEPGVDVGIGWTTGFILPGVSASALGVWAGVADDRGLASKYEPPAALSPGPGRAVRMPDGPGVGVLDAKVVHP